MIFESSYVLLLADQTEEWFGLESLLEKLRFTVEIANSPEQAIAKIEQTAPCLVIVQGDRWSHNFMCQLRTLANTDSMMVVFLTDFHAPSWLYQDQNPGFDGFLVKPISSDILSSLVQSASARQQCLTH
jgi:CheY-like chemotaxis protein